MRPQMRLVGAVALVFGIASSVKSEIVFHNIPTPPLSEPGGIVVDEGYHAGGVVQLAGVSRYASRIDVLLYEFGNGIPGDLSFRVNLWESPGLADMPGALLWTSAVQHASFPNRTPTLYSIDVPKVRVPDELAWTVEGLANPYFAGVAFSQPTTIGTSLGALIYNTQQWDISIRMPYPGGSGFRLIAVPEPTTIVLICLGAVAMLPIFLRRRDL